MADVVRTMRQEDLHAVLRWRNHDDVRRCMQKQHPITWDEHCSWFERCCDDPGRALLIVETTNSPLGFVQFNEAQQSKIAEWGFFAVPGLPRGSGMKLGRAALNYAFGFLRLHKVYGHVLDFNTASLKMHRRLGFQIEGVLREQCLIDDKRNDLICFGLLAREWTDCQTRVANR